MTADFPGDQVPDDLAEAFVLPEYIAQDERLSALHASVVTRLRREASGLPMNTVQHLLLERIAYNYVVIKHKEANNGFARANEQKDFNTFWLSMTQEFNKLLMANQDKLREALLLEITSIVNDALSEISDPDERRSVRRNLATSFAAIDL